MSWNVTNSFIFSQSHKNPGTKTEIMMKRKNLWQKQNQEHYKKNWKIEVDESFNSNPLTKSVENGKKIVKKWNWED